MGEGARPRQIQSVAKLAVELMGGVQLRIEGLIGSLDTTMWAHLHYRLAASMLE